MFRVIGIAVLLASLTAPAIAVEKLQVMGLFKNKAVMKIDGKRRVLSVGSESPEGVRLISADSQFAVVEIDGKESRLPLGNEVGANYASAVPSEVIIAIDNAGMYRTTGSINGQMVDFLADTGASAVALNANDARRLGIDFRLHGTEARVSTASGIERAYHLKLSSVKVGAIELNDVDAMVLEGDFPTEALLGMSFLGQLTVVNENGMMKLRKRF
ncbi:retropepsin-like aspartic protease family protein [Candidatus Reidiella endopervernicosa]|uniref:TIGR02281 family clan AA aspartic protease n=1 Tax=Candidatus Reidiella endopervernicosa TaxID=2738883 RepID=A0A6N0HZ26_9GAMM|nr:TIGR02281 family clan AA aspartic protease [Candidatus Reidiella endopervernicosa]QKQ27426.1 TIGR02281 family clan AA aspartic protease [Candidatus Reidiella endopervernicosa]